MKAIYLTALTALALGACNRSATDQNMAASTNAMEGEAGNVALATPPAALPGDAGVTTDPATYVARAGAGDLFEINSSKALLEKSKNAAVRQFAQMMVDQHTSSTSQIKAAAQADSISVSPPTLAPDQQTMLADIKAADPTTLDRIYLQHQRTAHAAALALHQGFARSQSSGQLRMVADKISGVVQKHLVELDKVEASVVAGR
ncbi:MAG: DUF4142 domain-containing protein [Chakrabartia sp.]